jgi:hypothetical protein
VSATAISQEYPRVFLMSLRQMESSLDRCRWKTCRSPVGVVSVALHGADGGNEGLGALKAQRSNLGHRLFLLPKGSVAHRRQRAGVAAILVRHLEIPAPPEGEAAFATRYQAVEK